MKKNTWFKHYNTAHEGLSIQSLLVVGDHEAVACWWILLELMSRHEASDDRGVIELPLKLLAKAWHVTVPKAERILGRLSVAFRSTLECTLSEGSAKPQPTCDQALDQGLPNSCSTLGQTLSEGSLKVQSKVASLRLSKWLKLQETRKKNESKIDPQNKEVRSKKKEERVKKEEEELDTEYSSEGVHSAPPQIPRKIPPKPDPDEKTRGARIWEAYSEAFLERYKTDPPRNATTNAQAANLGKRLGEDAIEVVRFYVNHNDSLYVREQHPIGFCLAKAEGLYTQWKTGMQVTSQAARKIEQSSYHKDQMKRLVGGS